MDTATTDEWKRYGQAVIQSMQEVLAESEESSRGPLLETADYWLSIGLAIGLRQPVRGERLLDLIEAHEDQRSALEEDAMAFCAEALK